ncbi:MAG: TonB-dependent receptor [Bacillota bacterium]
MNSIRLHKTLTLVFLFVAGAAAAADPAPNAATAAPPQPAPSATPATSPQTAQLGRITVTGTAIPRTSIETPAPVEIITATQIQQSGLTTVSDVLRSITADNSGTIPLGFTLGFAAGSTGLALRGLTVNSTLILIDGHRTAAYALADDGERSFTDLNTIPLNAVDHIEVLKDGASSIYGADAIAGVVNIILVKNYHDTQVKAGAGTSQHGGGTTTQFSYLGGTGDTAQDHYNAWVNFEYEKDDPIHNSQRGFPYNTADTSSLGGLDFNAGNPGLFFGSGYGAVAPSDASGNVSGLYQPLRPCNPADSKQVTVAGTGTFCEQNFVSLNDEILPEEDRYGLEGRMTADISSATTVNLTASFFQTRTVATANPSQIQVSSPNNTDSIVLPPTLLNGKLNPNDPFASSGKYAAINYAFGDIPGGFTDVNHNMRMVGEVNGDLGADWSYDAALTLNHTWLNVNNRGFINYQQLLQDIATGAYSFVNPASNSQAVRDALSPTIAKTSTTDMDALDFTANRDLMALSGGPLGLALGGQWRYEAQDDPDLNPNLEFQGLGIAHTIGSRTVSAVFVELDAPVLESLELDFAGREDHYSDFGSAFSPKFGVKWTPIPELGFRGTYSKGFRAPSFAENGSSAAEGFITYTLPASYIAAHGNDAYVQPYPLGLLTSANPNIQPERARNYTLGLIFQPFDSLSGTFDYYNIIKTGVIAQSSPFDVLNAYFAGQSLPPGSSISQDVPDPAHPTLLPRPTIVAAPYVNENELKTSGVDLSLVYKQDFAATHWTSDLDFTRILSFEETLSAGGPLVNYVGTQGPYILSSGAGTPRDRISWANSFDFGPANVTATINYVSGIFMSVPDVTGPGTNDLCFSTATPTGANLPADCRVPSFTYVDLTGEYDFTDKVSMTGAILNLFDRKAPFDPIDYAGVNYNPTYHSAGIVGRFFSLGLKAKF